jgi:hypothetical protein
VVNDSAVGYGTIWVTTPERADLANVGISVKYHEIFVLQIYVRNCINPSPLKNGDCIEFIDGFGEAITLANVPADGVMSENKWRLVYSAPN